MLVELLARRGCLNLCEWHLLPKQKAVLVSSRYIWLFPQKRKYSFKKPKIETSLVVQWLRLCVPKAGARVLSLVGEIDPTCHN